MVSYTNEEKLDMILIYGECGKNSKAAKRLYCERFRNRPMPSDKMFAKLAKNMGESGSFEKKRNVFKPRTARDEEHTVAVLARVFVDPHISIRQLATETDISYSSIQRILKDNKLRPYKIHLHQGLVPGDYERRLNFVAWLAVAQEMTILDRIMWSDESRFHNNGIVNRHNCHYWSQDNPHWLRETNFQNIWGINVWCGILNGQIIGPKFYEGTLTGERYLQFLREELLNFIEDVPLHIRHNMILQQDGAPPHNAIIVTNYLNTAYPGRWIGNRSEGVKWPARSPDLTPLDFFLWPYLKERVYFAPLNDVEDLKNRIRVECRRLNVEVLQHVCIQGVINRGQLCLEANGGLFEHVK